MFHPWTGSHQGSTCCFLGRRSYGNHCNFSSTLIALPFAGPLSDKLGRRISTAIGSGSYAIYLIGLALAFNAGTNGGYQIAYICAIVGGIANSFLDTGIYPAVSEIIYKAPGVATMGIKFFISVSQMLLPFVLGVTVATTATGATSYNTLFYACGIAYLVLLVLVMIFPLQIGRASCRERV